MMNIRTIRREILASRCSLLRSLGSVLLLREHVTHVTHVASGTVNLNLLRYLMKSPLI